MGVEVYCCDLVGEADVRFVFKIRLIGFVSGSDVGVSEDDVRVFYCYMLL